MRAASSGVKLIRSLYQPEPRARRRNLPETKLCYRPPQLQAQGRGPPKGDRPVAIKAFVLIVVDPARTIDVYNKLNAVDGISEVYQVMGPYDIVAVVEVPNLT